MNRNVVSRILMALIILSLPLVFSCDTAQDKNPFIVINVNYSGTVDSANKLYAIFYTQADWTGPFLTVESSLKQIIVPPLNIGQTPIYFEVIYDVDGNGIDSGDHYQGWENMTNPSDSVVPAAPLTRGNLTQMILPDSDLVMLNFDLDKHNVRP